MHCLLSQEVENELPRVTLAACGIAAAVLALRMRPPMTLAPQKSKQKTNVSDKFSDEERTESTIEP